MKKSVVVFLHIGYWVMYLSLAALLFLVMNMDKTHVNLHLLSRALFFHPFGFTAIIPALIGFYTFYFLLFDKFLQKKKMAKLFLSAIAVCALSAAITEIVIYFTFNATVANWGTNDVFGIALLVAFISIVNGTIGLIVKGFINWFNDIKFKLELTQKNYEMELALVKSQINPHFLFNTINNIDVLISKDATRASAYLNKLSDIMRFMLYETKPEKINLSKELTYIEKFIDLQKIRTTNEHYINYSIKGDPANCMIPPMLLISFIENAFKHVENKKVKNAINIHLEIEKEKLMFECENAYDQNTNIIVEQSGLGSNLIKKRLALLYPGKHSLKIINNNGMYKVALSLY
jgi:two-component system LytT family sensor kinase